jgi:hypothetical protein
MALEDSKWSHSEQGRLLLLVLHFQGPGDAAGGESGRVAARESLLTAGAAAELGVAELLMDWQRVGGPDQHITTDGA